MTVISVTNITAERSQEEDGDLAGKSENAEQGRRMGHLVDEPELRGRLHPCANERNQLTRKEELKVAVL